MNVYNIEMNVGQDSDFNYKIKPGELTFIEYDNNYSHLRVLFKFIANRDKNLKNVKGISNLKHNKTREKFNRINDDQINHKINKFISPENIDSLEEYDLIYFLDIDSLEEYIKTKTDYNNIKELLKDHYKNNKDYHIIIFSDKSISDIDFDSQFLHNIFILKHIDKTEDKMSGKINTIIKNTKALTQAQQSVVALKYDKSVKTISNKRI